MALNTGAPEIYSHAWDIQSGEKFENAIKKAVQSCKQSGNNPNYHFVGADKPILLRKKD